MESIERKESMGNVASLIPMAETYLENNLNILLIGLHGTGKTQSIMELAKAKDIKMKYYSCATLDPYTDLVGVPVPQVDGLGHDYLKMVRPRDVDEAELIFFDEFNRADPKVVNAVFEIIQFRSINGEPLPNLKCCWAAINPPDKDYVVEQLDPAMVDRFDGYIEIKPTPSVDYLSQRMPLPIAQALKAWWDDHDKDRRDFEDYISPRRLEKIGVIYNITKNQQAVKQALPPGGKYDTTKLIYNLEVAVGKRKKNEKQNNIGVGASDKFTYTNGGLFKMKNEIIQHLKDNPYELETQKRIVDVFKKTSLGADTLVSAYGEILNELNPQIFEGFFNNLSSTKKSQIRSSFQALKNSNPKKTTAIPNVEKVLAKGARAGTWNP